MADRRLPDLSDTARRYVEDTRRARLASPGIEHFRPARRSSGGIAAAAIGIAALIAAMLWLAG